MDKREILHRVANGDLTPQEAADLLEGHRTEIPLTHQTPPVPPVPPEPNMPPPPGTGSPENHSQEHHSQEHHSQEHHSQEHHGPEAAEPVFPDAQVSTVRLNGAFRSAVIIADPTVKTAAVGGRHSAHVEGNVLVIEGDDETHESFQFERAGRRRRRNIAVSVEGPRPHPLNVRINPSLALEATVAAGSLRIHGLRGPVKAEVSAGSLTVEDVTGDLDLATAAGPIKVRGRISQGDHRIRCEAGAVKVVLEEGSDVTISARASLGKVSLPGVAQAGGFSIGDASGEAKIGEGRARMSIECALGAVKVVMADEDKGGTWTSTTRWESR